MRLEIYNINGTEVAHDALRITKFDELNDFLTNHALVPNEVDDAVYHFINGYEGFQFAGDGGGLGFIVDVWDNAELEGDPVDSLQVWLDEYKEYM